MSFRRIAMMAALAIALALPLSNARAQLYYPCGPSPFEWSVCIGYDALAVVGLIFAQPLQSIYLAHHQPALAYPPPPPDIAPPLTYGGPYYYPRRW